MRKFTAILLVFSLIFFLCACGHKGDGVKERKCGIFVTVEADDIYAVSCATDDGSESGSNADGSVIKAGDVFHFDIAGDKAEQSTKAVISYMISAYDKDLNVIEAETFEDNFANMARIDIVITKDHHIIYKGGEVNCGGKLVVSMNEYEDSLGVNATDTYVSVSGNEDAGNKISESLKSFVDEFTAETEANRASYESNTSGKSGEIPEFSMLYSLSVTRGDDAVVSFRTSSYAYLGTEEKDIIAGHNYDVETGSELKLENVFNDVDAVKNLCTEQILISTASSDVVFNEGFTSVIPELVDDGNWYLDSEGLVVIANKGDIADTSYEFRIPYPDLEQYINEQYIPVESTEVGPGSINAVLAADANIDDYVFVGDLETDKDIIISASGNIYNIGVYNVTYNEEDGSYGLSSQLLYCSDMSEGGAFTIDNTLESTPNILVQYTTANGDVKNNFLSVDENGKVIVTDHDGGDTGIDVMEMLPFTVDLDGNGSDETVSISGGTIKLTANSGSVSFKTELEEISVAKLYDIDSDGSFELFVGGDLMSDDYILYCLKFDGNDIRPITIDGEDYISGSVSSFTGNVMTVNDKIDVLGTYAYERNFEYADGKIAHVAAESYKVISETYITPTADLATVDGGTITSGTPVKVIETDMSSFVTVETEDGTTGKLKLAQNSGDTGWLVNGSPENDLFSDIRYAD